MTTEQQTGVPKADVLAAADYYRDLAFSYGDRINDGPLHDDLVDDAVHSIKAGLCREFSNELYRMAGVHVPMSQRGAGRIVMLPAHASSLRMHQRPPGARRRDATHSAWRRVRRAWACLFSAKGRI